MVNIENFSNSRWEQYYDIPTLRKYINIEFWDCSKITSCSFPCDNPLQVSFCKEICSFKQLKAELQRLDKNSVIIQEVHFIRNNIKFHKLVSKYIQHCVYIQLYHYTLPNITNSFHQFESIEKKLTLKECLYKIKPLLILCKFIKFHGGKAFQNWFRLYCASVKEQRRHDEYDKYSKKCIGYYSNYYEFSVVPGSKYFIKAPDLESYLKLKDTPNEFCGRYVVYIDEYFPYHPDLKTFYKSDYDSDKIAKEYHSDCNSFFNKIENEYNCRIIIAAHPSANYNENPFDDREIVKFKTAELIKGSIGVLLHDSTISILVPLFNKPYAVLSCPAIDEFSGIRSVIESYATSLECDITNIHTIKSVSNIFTTPSEKLRDKVIGNYSDELLAKRNGQLFAEYLEEILQDDRC